MRTFVICLGWGVWVWRQDTPEKLARVPSVLIGLLLAFGIWVAFGHEPTGTTPVQLFLDQFSFLFGAVTLYLLGAWIAFAAYSPRSS